MAGSGGFENICSGAERASAEGGELGGIERPRQGRIGELRKEWPWRGGRRAVCAYAHAEVRVDLDAIHPSTPHFLHFPPSPPLSTPPSPILLTF